MQYPAGRAPRRHSALFLLPLLLGMGCSEHRGNQPPVRPRPPGSLPGSTTPSAPSRGDAVRPPARLAQRVTRRGRSITVPVEGAQLVRRGDHVDVLATLSPGPGQGSATLLLMQNLIVLERVGGSKLALLVLPEEGELLALSAWGGTLHVARRHPEDPGVLEERRPVDGKALLDCALVRKAAAKRIAALSRSAGPPPAGPAMGLREVVLPLRGTEGVDSGDRVDVIATFPAPPRGEQTTRILLETVVVSRRVAPNALALLLALEEVEPAVQAARLGRLHVMLRHPRDHGTTDEAPLVTRAELLTGEARGRCPEPRDPKEVIKIIRGLPGITDEPPPRRPAPPRPPDPPGP